MFIFAHLGIGKRMSEPWILGLPLLPVFVGTLLPDLIDKPLYYGLSWQTGRWAGDLGLISGTRTFGHSGMLALVLFLLSRRSPVAKALFIGALTHIVLDTAWGLLHIREFPSALVAFFWPLLGSFPVMPHKDASEHLGTAQHTAVLFTEALGLALLILDRRKHRSIEQ